MAESRQFFSIPEAAALMGVSRIAVFKKVKKGQLAAIRIGRNWAIPAHAVAAPEAAPPPRPADAAPRKVPAPTTIPRRPPAAPREPVREKDPLDEMGWD
jgi:excisionase family DNA binding protein